MESLGSAKGADGASRAVDKVMGGIALMDGADGLRRSRGRDGDGAEVDTARLADDCKGSVDDCDGGGADGGVAGDFEETE